MLYDFILISSKNEDAARIQKELQRNKLYKVSLIDDAAAALKRIQSSTISCLVFNMEAFTTEKLQFAYNLRSMGHNFPVIIFSKFAQREALDQLQKISKTVLIEKPFESKDVWGITDKLVQGRKVEQRIYRRFFTDQKAIVKKVSSETTSSARIYNLSRGGAYLEIDPGGESLVSGESLKLSVQLEKISKEYVVEAEVVWAASKGFWAGNPAVGLRFIKAGDVYRNLLEKL